MGINHRASTISVATITIIFCFIRIINAARATPVYSYYSSVYKGTNLESTFDLLAGCNKANIAFNVLLILSATLMLTVCNADIEVNVKRRIFLLPHIVMSTLSIIATVVMLGLLEHEFHGNTTYTATVMALGVIGVLLNILFTTLMALHYRFLVKYQG